MLKQSLVQEAVADVSTAPPLPPLNNLPQWSRINTLDKARYPKPFLKDRLQPLPNTQHMMDGGLGKETDSTESLEDVQQATRNGTDANSNLRIQHLEKCIHFLQQQHQDVLSNLHDEIDKLRRENKELQFKIIMVQRNSPPSTSPPSASQRRVQAEKTIQGHSNPANERNVKQTEDVASASTNCTKVEDATDMTTSDGQSASTDSKMDELKVIFLEEEIKELKKQLKEEKSRNNYLNQLLLQTEKQKLQTQQQNQAADQEQSMASTAAGAVGQTPAGSQGAHPRSGALGQHGMLPFNATMVPLQVRLPHKAPRPPTLSECEVIIRHLQQLNDKQAHELNQLKTDLRDVLYSHKWTPDAYLLAKAYVAEDDAKESADKERLPRIPFKQQARKLPDVAYIQKDAVTLPALKQTMGNKAIERRKRTQILQKARVRREVMPNAIESTGNE